MTTRILMTASHYNSLRQHLLEAKGPGFAFLFAGTAISRNVCTLLVRAVRPVRAEELRAADGHGIELSDVARRDVFSYSARSGCAVIEAHTHGGVQPVRFSLTDLAGFHDIVRYVKAKMPDTPYAATVWGADSVDARVWHSGSLRHDTVEAVRVVGPHSFNLYTTSSRRPEAPDSSEDRYERQEAAFGETGQRRLSGLHVAVVGLGGIGSHVAQQLAYLGVSRLTLVDDDSVEASNLNRLIGAAPIDRGSPKVHVARRLIKAVHPIAQVAAVRASLMSYEALDAVKTCDIVLGCTDTDGSRLVLNELSKAYLIPYIDCASEINVGDGRIAAIGGSVALVLPDGPCLLCMKHVDLSIAQEELESPEEKELRRAHGYVTGADVHTPSVVSLNGVIASLAVGELIALVTGWREPLGFQVYYGDGRRTPCVMRRVHHDPGCVVCAEKLAAGDAARLQRYVRTGLPRDLPQ